MTDFYVWSGATGAANGTSWTNAYTTLLAAVTSKAAGDNFYVAHDHSESTAGALSITAPGGDNTLCRILAVNRAGSVPPVSADLRVRSAQVSCTGTMTIAATYDIFGVIFSAGNNDATAASITVGNTANRSMTLRSCHLKLNNSAAGSRLNVPGNTASMRAVLEDTTVEFGNVGQSMTAGGRVIWRNTASVIAGATIPTNLCTFANGGVFLLEGLDFSAIVTGKTVFGVNNATALNVISNCKLGSGGVVASAGASGSGGVEFAAINVDSGDTNYLHQKITYAGTLTTETTIVRTGGATDGTTPVSWKIVTAANTAKPEIPFECPPITIWNETIGSSITVTLYGAKSGGLPNNGNVWIEVQYLGNSGTTQSAKATNGKADYLPSTGTTTYTDAGQTWGGGLTDDWAMSVSITPQEKGPITIYPRIGAASATYYIDPKPVIT